MGPGAQRHGQPWPGGLLGGPRSACLAGTAAESAEVAGIEDIWVDGESAVLVRVCCGLAHFGGDLGRELGEVCQAEHLVAMGPPDLDIGLSVLSPLAEMAGHFEKGVDENGKRWEGKMTAFGRIFCSLYKCD